MLCSLLVELTVVPSTSITGAELFHQSAEDAYESAIHALRSPKDHRALWKEYIFYMKAKSVNGGCDDFLRLVDCVLRCLIDVDDTCATDSEENSRETQITDYSYHNEVQNSYRVHYYILIFWNFNLVPFKYSKHVFTTYL